MSELINGNWLQTMEGSLDNIESYTLATANALGATAGTATTSIFLFQDGDILKVVTKRSGPGIGDFGLKKTGVVK